MKNLWIPVLLAFFSSASWSLDYSKIEVGELSGKLTVQWLEPDVFLFIPDKENPLKFRRKNGWTITPGRMLTDGGSIPRPMWAFRNYSPWGYAPSFIVHDWLFHMKRCKIDGFDRYDLESSALVMVEIMKTMMETGKVEKSPSTTALMYEAVTSIFAKQVWDRELCVPVPPAFNITPKFEYQISF